MTPTKIILFALTAVALVSCKPTPAPENQAAETPGAAATAETVPFRARIVFEPPEALTADARLLTYVLEANFEDGSRRLVAEQSISPPGESPALIQIDVARTELSPELGYEMYAAMVDGNDRLLMTVPSNRAPVPATGLHWENTYNLRLLPVSTPAPPDEVFHLPGELAYACEDLVISVRQADDASVIMTLRDVEVTLNPAVATAGGRFTDARHEFWITKELQGFLNILGEAPRPCERR